jgi:glycerol kinase
VLVHAVWLDSRTHAIVEELLRQENFQPAGKDTLRPICGLPLSTYFSATKLVWLIKNVPAVQKAIQDDRCIFGTVDTWLIWVHLRASSPAQTNPWLMCTRTPTQNMTGGPNGGAHVTDVTNASRTMLMNLKTLQWDSSACECVPSSPLTLPHTPHSPIEISPL